MVDVEQGTIRLLVDNHEPFGFHIHAGLPKVKKLRVKIEVEDYNKAMDFFFEEVRRIVSEENT